VATFLDSDFLSDTRGVLEEDDILPIFDESALSVAPVKGDEHVGVISVVVRSEELF